MSKKYSHDEAYAATLEYFGGDELAAKVAIDKYLLRDNDNNLLEKTPTDMHWRIANEIARIEKNKFKEPLSAKTIFELLDKFKYIVLQGRPMYGIGNKYQYISLSNCTTSSKLLDSYGSIHQIDQEISQLCKRGCIEENSYVVTLNNELRKIKDINIGEYVLSYNPIDKIDTYNKVLHKEYINTNNYNVQITTYRGILTTTCDHPILIFDSKSGTYKYCEATELNSKTDFVVTPIQNNDMVKLNNDIDKENIAWFIGAHMGDGSCGKNKLLNDYRFRILGDNEEVVKRYGSILNQLTGSNAKYIVSTKKNYKSKVWEYSNNKKSNSIVLTQFLDNQYGQKCYSGQIPKYIINNNLWIPFIAGLIDTDGYIRKQSSIDITICAKDIVDKIACYLSMCGVIYSIGVRHSKRINEKIIYKVMIHVSNKDFIKNILSYMCHDKKISVLAKYIDGRSFSHLYPLSDSEIQDIRKRYTLKRKTETSSLLKDCSAYISLLHKNKSAAIGMLLFLRSRNLISKEKVEEIQRRIRIKSIQKIKGEEQKYLDITVANNNNFYTGNFGLFCVHNCGIGLDLSELRPNNTSVTNSAKYSTGIIPFVKRFSNTIREVGQGARRGASLQSLNVHHPQILDFIHCKNNNDEITGSNLSVQLTNEFLTAVQKKQQYTQKWPISNPKIKNKIDASIVWDEIVRSAHKYAEPGIQFIDTVRKTIPSECYEEFKTYATNPCGEQYLAENDCCRLALLNMYSYVEQPLTKYAIFDFRKWYNHAQLLQRIQDDIVDLEIESIQRIINKIMGDPEPESTKAIELQMWNKLLEKSKMGRRTGTGFTGLGDTLAALNLKYDSDEAIEITSKICQVLKLGCYKSSIDMAKEIGAFPIWDYSKEKDNVYLNNIKDDKVCIHCCSPGLCEEWIYGDTIYQDMQQYGRRNITCLTISPAGSVSLLTQTTSGIEPCFQLQYVRRRKINPHDKETKVDFIDNNGDKWTEYTISHHKLAEWTKITGNNDIKQSPWYNNCAKDINHNQRLKLQSEAQKHIDNSISSTINLPNNISVEEVGDLYFNAWKLSLKGLTIYREGSRDGVLLDKTQMASIPKTNAPTRPKELLCDVHHVTVSGKKYFVLVGLLGEDKAPYEVFAGKNGFLESSIKSGKIIRKRRNYYKAIFDDSDIELSPITASSNDMEEAITRLCSGMLRHGANIQYIVSQLEKVGEKGAMHNFALALSRALKKYIKDGTKEKGYNCPECGNESVIRQEGCLTCVCGWSKC